MNEKKIKNQRILVGGIVGILLLAFALVVLYNGSKINLDDNDAYSKKLYTGFIEELNDYVNSFDATVDYDTAKTDLAAKIIELQKTYEGGDGVAYVANKLINNTLTIDYASTSDYLGAMSMDIGSFFSGLFGGSSDSSKNLTMRSNTVCDGGTVKDSKYCVDKLNAKVYVTDKKSKKWVVLVHGNNMNGKQMYDAVGEMYASQGYNVLAPDLRGFGDSDGNCAMGYLESLDIYDWIKYLNSNPSDFGVSSVPDTIIVHGVSLGGATTLLLATNPDIANASGTGVYSKNLTQLHVKGFVDDCGYTSISGIITGLLSGGDDAQTSTLFDYFNIDGEDFLSTLKQEASKLGIKEFDKIDLSGITNGTDLNEIFGQVNDALNGFVQSSGSANQITIPNSDSLWDGQAEIPSIDSSNNWWNQIGTGTSAKNGSSVTLVEYSSSSSVIDTLLRNVIMKLLNTGLDDSNYDKYSNAFYSGRTFPSGAKIMIIHGTSDTIVNHSNAETVAANIGSADLFYKWDAEGKPHAFIVAGLDKDNYSNLVASYTKYVDNGVKSDDVFEDSSSTTDDNSSSGVSGILKKITNFFKGLFG